MVVVGPLATQPEPYSYDLCQDHAQRLTVPQGWQVVRLHTRFDEAPLDAADPEALLQAIQAPLPASSLQASPAGNPEINPEISSVASEETGCQRRHPSGQAEALPIDGIAGEAVENRTATITDLAAIRGDRAAQALTPSGVAPQNSPEFGPFTPQQ